MLFQLRHRSEQRDENRCLEPCHNRGRRRTVKPKFVEAKISGLSEKTQYFYRLHTKNAFGEDKGGTATSRRSRPPEPRRARSAAVERTTATLRGFVTPNDAKVTSCDFEYGRRRRRRPRSKIGDLRNAAGAVKAKQGSGQRKTDGPQRSHALQFRLVAGNGFGVGHSGNGGFTTEPSGTEGADAPRPERDQRIGGTVSVREPRRRQRDQCYFEYGTTPALGQVATMQQSARRR